MGRIIKALILGWTGKKIYDRVSADDQPPDQERETPRARKQPASHIRRKAAHRKQARAA